MSEWISVLAVFWALWAADGARLWPRQVFTACGWRSAFSYSRLSLPGVWPGSWRVTTADVPLALSPIGLSNVPAGAAGRPAEEPDVVRAWRWEEVREVGLADGWIFINGARFCLDTGHVSAPQVLELARLPVAERARKIDRLIRRWLRPAHLRRRARVLKGRTVWVAYFNTCTLLWFAALSCYVVGEVATVISEAKANRLAAMLPTLLAILAATHVAAIYLAWRAGKRLRPVAREKRGSNLFSALMLPPQAMRLRALVGEGFFPAQHPVALALAFGNAATREERAFHATADLRWPKVDANHPVLAVEIAQWFRSALDARLVPLLTAAGVAVDGLLAAPVANSPASCLYCPRCRDQFMTERAVCPHGIKLLPLARR